MLPKINRLTSSKDFQNITKTGVRVYSQLRNIVNETLETIPGNIQVVIRALPKVTEIEFSELSKIITEGITKSIVKANV